jgi:hypothetical protein
MTIIGRRRTRENHTLPMVVNNEEKNEPMLLSCILGSLSTEQQGTINDTNPSIYKLVMMT